MGWSTSLALISTPSSQEPSTVAPGESRFPEPAHSIMNEGSTLMTRSQRRQRPSRRLQPAGPGLALLPLRAFLAVTFVYAGVQKLSDPGFLHPGSPTYIGSQLHAFARGTPAGFLLRWFALRSPAVAGVGVALTEIAIGVLVGVGLLTRVVAGAGLALNLLLFLTASWNTHPYFLGSDIVFVFGWLTVLLAGPSGQPALDNVLANRTTRAGQPSRRGGMAVYDAAEHSPPGLSRRDILRRGLGFTGAATIITAGLAWLLRGGYQTTPSLAAQQPLPRNRHRGSPHRSRPTGSHRAQSSVPAGAVRVGPSSRVATSQAATYTDPTTGSADVLIRQSDGTLTALSAICTHAGCEVAYQGGVLYCPCHGSRFNATTGAVIQGPAVTPLPKRRVIESGGEIYAVPG
jgi:thiosulfate dehydrogenase [quinone] large subunit